MIYCPGRHGKQVDADQVRKGAHTPMTVVLRSVALFVVAGLCEIGGGYLIWQWWRSGASWLVGLCGAVLLVGYGFVPTYQPAHFGRTYAASGGVFVILSVLWS
jgi:small multidrug resistance family-3 protein